MVVCEEQGKGRHGRTRGRWKYLDVGASCCTVRIATVAADVVDIVVVRVNDINHNWPNVLVHCTPCSIIFT